MEEKEIKQKKKYEKTDQEMKREKKKLNGGKCKPSERVDTRMGVELEVKYLPSLHDDPLLRCCTEAFFSQCLDCFFNCNV